MTAQERQLEELIRSRANKSFEVRGEEGDTYNISPVDESEAILLARSGCIRGHINKHGFLRYLVLKVSIHAARRILKRGKRHADERLPIADDNYTVRRVSSPLGQYYEYREEVTRAYAPLTGR